MHPPLVAIVRPSSTDKSQTIRWRMRLARVPCPPFRTCPRNWIKPKPPAFKEDRSGLKYLIYVALAISIAFAEPQRSAGRVTYEAASDPSNATGSKDKAPSPAR